GEGAAVGLWGSGSEAVSREASVRAGAAMQAWSQRWNDVCCCLEARRMRIKDVRITRPQFSGVDKLRRERGDQVCDAVVDRVNDHVPGDMEPWKDYDL
ncbi:conjugal transfer protein, partial [Escherichia coli]|uniref:conjugal transfer protein n=1 Tax=Escherichia coli TaxID=562 RepID=UPI000989BC99